MKPLLLFLLTASIHAATPVADIKVPAGFKVELLREAGQREGSWISMALDAEGRIYISPQGSIPESGMAKDSKWGGLWRATLRNSQSQIANSKAPESGNPSGKEPSSNDKPPASAPASAIGDLPSAITKWEKVPVPVGDSMGMLWAFDSLYVSGNGPEGRGIYRCKDTDGDSLPDTAVMWKKVPGSAGEHGAHALVLSPDKKNIYIVHGNSTGLIEGIAPDSPYRNWGEDDLLPKLKDPTATFFDSIKAPYGYVVRTDEEGKKWELIAGGFRNPYDIDFNADGELFTYDSDMEWDRGLPWYRPTRVLHIVPGGEYGFREGSAKMPAYYPDTLPAAVDIGLGCPTGVKFGTRSNFGEKYRRAFFVCDWTYGRILAVHMKEKGASYTATNPRGSATFPKDAESSADVEPFVVGKGMPVTDVEFLKDGSMVFTTGGRGTSAGLYRVSYGLHGQDGRDGQNGRAEPENASPSSPLSPSSPPNSAATEKKPGGIPWNRPEKWEGQGPFKGLAPAETKQAGSPVPLPGSAAFLQQSLRDGTISREDSIRLIMESKDRFAEFALRRLVTPKSLMGWFSYYWDNQRGFSARVISADPKEIALNFLLKVVGETEPATQVALLKGLRAFPLADLPDDLKLLKLRILELTFARHGRPSEEWQKLGLEKLLAAYPAQGPRAAELNRELSQLLVWLSQPELGDMNPAASEKKGAPAPSGAAPIPSRVAPPANGAAPKSSGVTPPARGDAPISSVDALPTAMDAPGSCEGALLAVGDAPVPSGDPVGNGKSGVAAGSGGTPAADSVPKPESETPRDKTSVGDKSVAAPIENPGAVVHAGRKGAAFHAELGQQVIEKTLALMDAAPSQEEQIHYALVLRWAHGWTPPQRERYFRWFHEKGARLSGGNSMQGFIKKIHAEAAARVPADERAPIAQWLAPLAAPAAEALKARPFVKAWTLAELETALDAMKDRKPDLARGKQLYAEAQCARCHLYKDTGGNVGPDLTAVAQRFQRHDILEAITDPNKAVSEQYALTTLTGIKFGEEEVTGLMQEETSGTIRILTDSLTGATREFYHNVVKKKDKALVSMMPPALLNTLTAEEVGDLLGFLGR